MKKIINIISGVALLGSLMILPTSCKKSFLDEEVINSRNTSDFQKTEGLDGLVIGMYQSLKFHFNYTWAYTSTNYGVDEFTVGGDRTEQMWNSYDGSLNSFNSDVQAVFDNMYTNINSANIVIKNVPVYYTGANKNTRLGEGYFMRAFDYFKLVKQFGGVPLQLESLEIIKEEFTRNSAKEVYEQVIQDFIQAYTLLPATPGETGRLTKWAAAHFLAKAYLFRASEMNNDWNGDTKTADLQNAVKYADLVIGSGQHTLATNFSDLWNFTAVDGPNESNKEIILAAQFSNNTATQGRYGNQVHLYYPSVYQNLPGMQRDIPGGREFQRMRSTDYAIDVFDRVNDSRFWKSFKTRYLCNNPAGAPKWTAATAPTPALVNQVKFTGGQESILYIINDANDTRYTSTNITLRAPSIYVRYFAGQAQSYLNAHGNYGVSQYPALSKFMDGSRNLIASQFGQRDGILARLAETYLIAAEAYGRLGQYAQAIPYLNSVRDRAAYKEGEDRSAYVDGGVSYKTNPAVNSSGFVSYSDKNTYFESNNIPVTTANTLTSMHLNSEADIFNSNKDFYDKVAASSNADKFKAFILDERSRELMGELMRWEDLARTKTLVARTAAFNLEAKPAENKHYLRPIPQNFLDVLKIGGEALTPAQKQAIQNPGW
ncbi:RagB/SusD family nutrient uptake outer membrane protein [Pedobacter psychrodurus]|uniref:RagB/SusD family nutrient uptake outer membrane protein n=1 Tax=Pedobacter psychrodurus TaxID=2530456 RepID=A0A4R0PU35_9SPHI|nr:RagB/SusD family nutrient uptake outer membrane protein [Pedobacter psychrodurus]TCD25547.1 RagB/SusD family nutrient uptake outer membrane protein [Pedobacter psychrodurus]